ncbi:MAG: peptide deformylase [Candidatus Pacebacteria bacterium]|nr:peptide deformylase [Candidatus Paceibacterota bacterium]
METNSIHTIKKYPDPVLKKRSEEIKAIDDEIKSLTKEMVLLMEKEKGVGLAAPQVGVLRRLIVFESGKGVIALINPKIAQKSKEKFSDLEGCLSFPDLWVKIRRPKKILLEALNLEGQTVQIEAEGMAARVIQHEIDHLNGTLLLDKMNLIQRWKARNIIGKMKRNYGSC